MAFLFKTFTSTQSSQITGTRNFFRQATFFAFSGFNAAGTPIPNSGTIYLGLESNKLPIVIPPSGSYTLDVGSAHTDLKESFANIWVKGGNTVDGVYVWYY